MTDVERLKKLAIPPEKAIEYAYALGYCHADNGADPEVPSSSFDEMREELS